MIKKIILVLFMLSLSLSALKTPIYHKIDAKISPNTSMIEVKDIITINASLLKSGLNFKLHHALVVGDNKFVKKIKSNVIGKDIGMDKDDVGAESKLKLNLYKVFVPKNHKGNFTFTLKYKGKIESPIKQSAENYARGFSESSGIIWSKGVYLAGSTYWLPFFNEEMITYTLTTTAPKKWKVVSVGKRTYNEVKGDSHIDTWDSPTPQEEVFLIAAPFNEYSKSVGMVKVMAFLRTPDEALANKYLETTAQYMEMYRKLVGPYPYTKFALVENFWETGYGMPSFTLLGEKIIRFPFILHSSYPHELLHNWWGNSVFVDFKTGNWCEGITAYMADHLIKEQRGQGEEYRRSTLQGFTNFVNPSNDFPVSKFLSRYDEASKSIGYGKVLMINHMLRRKVGDANFIKAYQKFNRDNKFTRASFQDIRKAFEAVTGKNLKPFFEQWVKRLGAPRLVLKNVKVKNLKNNHKTVFELRQTQNAAVFTLDVPVAILTAKGMQYKTVVMNKRIQIFTIATKEKPLKIMIDPQFDLFRLLDPRETPATFTKAFGAKKTLIILPDIKSPNYKWYKEFADLWTKKREKMFVVKSQDEVSKLPKDKSILLLSQNNKFAPVINKEMKKHNSEILKDGVRYGKEKFPYKNNSFFISSVNPYNVREVMTILSIGNAKAVKGLARKLVHYAKYSYLAFAGGEPSNIAKGQWTVNNSPLMKNLDSKSKFMKVKLERRKALASLTPVFSADRMMKTITYLASDEMKGRGLGTKEIDEVADYIAKKFKEYGLKPGADDGSYFQKWTQNVLDKKNIKLKNVIGYIPGTNPNLKKAIVVSAHYDHLGFGWPVVKKGNEGKIHNGADDNASGVSVVLELAKVLGKNAKPIRPIIFVAFTAEESGLVGSRYFVKNYKKFKAFADINIDTVGRLFENKLMILNTDTAREWKFIFMGVNFTTGVKTALITQDLDASDQMAFIEVGVPGVQLFFSGINSDYHVPEDDTDKIDPAGLVKTATVAREVIQYFAERKEPIAFTGRAGSRVKKVPMKNKTARRASTGTMPDFAFSGVGVRLAGVTVNSSAAKAGLLKGDVIIAFDGKPVKNLRDYSNFLKEHQPGDMVVFTIKRDKIKKDIKIKLSER